MGRPASSSHLFLRNRVFYFRFCLNSLFPELLGRNEVRMSLRTSYRDIAIKLASLLEVFMIDLLTRLANGEKITQLTNARILQLAREFYADRHEILEVLAICQPNSPAKYARLQAQEQELKQILMNHDYDDVSVDVQSFLITNDIPFPDNEVDYSRLAREIVKTMLDINTLEQSRATLDFKTEQRILEKYLPTVEQLNHPSQDVVVSPTNPVLTEGLTPDKHGPAVLSGGITGALGEVATFPTPLGIRPKRLQEALDSYTDMKISRGHWTEKNQRDMIGKIAWLPFLIGNPYLHEITHEQMLEFSSNLLKMPPHRNSSHAYKGKSAAELLDMDIPKTISVATANHIISTVHTFFEDCCTKDYMLRNRAEGINLVDKRPDNTKRDCLNSEDLQQLFTELGKDCHAFKHDWQYWLPILGYFTGCRLNEMCQLHLTDIRETDGIHYISINDDSPDKHLKNKASRRNVPLHPELTRLGFLDFIQQKQTENCTSPYLFSGMKHDSKLKLSHYPSKWLNPYFRKIGITDETKTFHSLRHSFKHDLDRAWVEDTISARLMGHKLMNREGNANYDKDMSVSFYYSEGIMKIEHEVDFNLLLPVNSK